MALKPLNKRDQSTKDQVGAFRKAARELGCDESEERFQDVLRTVARQRPTAREDGEPAGKAKRKVVKTNR
jgi:hypothetical protein